MSTTNQPLTNQVYKDFNKYMKGFNKELLANFPHIGMLSLMNTSYVVCKKLNKKLPHKLFNKYIAVFEKEILSKNEPFFLSDRFTSSFWPSFVEMIKTEWIKLDEANKEAVWTHMQVLVALNRRCLEYRQKKYEPDSGDENI